MPKCENCKKSFSNKVKIEGKIRNLQRRNFCLDCSPFRQHNTSRILDADERTKKRREQQVKYVTKWRQNQKLKLLAYKGGKCVLCGYDKPISGAYSFHHRDPKKKDFTISKRGHCRSWELVKKEVDKCDLLCVRCHAEIHHKLEEDKTC